MLAALVAGGVAAFRALRPKGAPSTGASLPPKIRPVPAAVPADPADETTEIALDQADLADAPDGPSDAALGGTPTEG